MKTKWIRVLAIVPASAMIFMDQSILPVALPTIAREFGAANTPLQWTVNSYLLALALFLLVFGKLGDRIGHRRSFLLGMVLFAFFSILCSLSKNVWQLIGARGLQGMGAALMLPAQSALIAHSFPKSARGRVTGLVVSIGSIFLVSAPLIGGYLTQKISWNWIFWINIPIALIGVILILALLPDIEGKKSPIDPWGFAFFAGFAGTLTTVFMQAGSWGWSSPKIAALAAISLFSLFFLLLREKAMKFPFLDLSLFKSRPFSAININIAITQFVVMIYVFRVIYLQKILGYTPLQTGLIAALTSSPVLFFSYIGGFLADKINPKLPVIFGYALIIASFLWLSFVPLPTLFSLCASLLLFGMGIPLIFTPSYTLAMSSVPQEKFGAAFGMISTLRMFAGSVGLSMIHLFVSSSIKRNISLLGDRVSTIQSFSYVHRALAFLMLCAFLASIFIHRQTSRGKIPKNPAEGWD